MRNLWYLALIFLATSICTAQIPNLVGTGLALRPDILMKEWILSAIRKYRR